MKPIEGRGRVHFVASKYILIAFTGASNGLVYGGRNVCQSSFVKGDDVQFRCEKWDPIRLPDYLRNTDVRYKATVVRYSGVSEKVSDEGSVTTVNERSILIKYGKDQVHATFDKCSPDLEVDDIVKFTAESWEKPPAHLVAAGVRYRGVSVVFLGKPRSINAEGYFSLIDAKGQYGFINGYLDDGEEFNVFCTLTMVKPVCTNLNERFNMDSVVRFQALQQGANKKNNMTKWRATIVTDKRYLITSDEELIEDPENGNDAELSSDDDDDLAAARQQMLLTSVGSSNTAVGVSSNRNASRSTDITNQFANLLSTSGGSSHQAADVADAAEQKKFNPAVTRPVPTGKVSTASSQPSVAGSSQNYDMETEALLHLPWNPVACIPYDETRSEMLEENRKLRVLAHYMMEYKNCAYCLKHTHPQTAGSDIPFSG